MSDTAEEHGVDNKETSYLTNKMEQLNVQMSTTVLGTSPDSDNRNDEYSKDNDGNSPVAAETVSEVGKDTETDSPLPWNPCSTCGLTSYSEEIGAENPEQAMIYEFEIPQTIVGRLIGKYGTYVNRIKMTTGANIIVKRHISCPSLKICAVEGYATEIEDALGMIRDRFPEKKFPFLSLQQVNQLKLIPCASAISFLPPNNKLSLIEGVVNDVTVCCVTALDTLFLQQPTHPTFPALPRLRRALLTFYEEASDAPRLVKPFNIGVICVARGKSGEWFRAEVVSLDEETDRATVRLVDEGGYLEVAVDELRQIRFDFVTVPFQAAECKLAGVTLAENSASLTAAARDYFNELCQGQILQAHILGYAYPSKEPLIYLYRMNEKQVPVLVNQEIAEKGLVKWTGHNAEGEGNIKSSPEETSS